MLWVFGAIGTISAIYFGYKFIIDPLFIHDLPDLKGKAPVYPAPENTSPDITLTDRVGSRVSNVTNSFATIFTGFRNKLNPFNWLPVANGESIKQFQTFMENQNNMSTADRRFYPFTEVNPILPWYKQLKTQLLGESMSESLQRFKDRAYAERIYNSLQVSRGEFTNVAGLTPNIGGLGIGTNSPLSALNSPIPGFNFVEAVHTVNIENKFNSIPSTPITIHKPIPGEFLETVGGNLDQWSSHEKAPHDNKFFETWKDRNTGSWKKPSYAKVASTSK